MEIIFAFIVYFCIFEMYTKTNTKMERGTLKFFDEKKGFGFIVEEKSGKDVFVHHSGLVDKLAADEKVTFELAEDRKGVKAVNVKRA
jgi:cold shock protein